jgi:hypothetical protein
VGEFHYVQEGENEFLSLFPHRYDYIYANHLEPEQTPQWQTERRYPLSDRILHQGAYLFGVRFGKETSYCMLDIDIGSAYHPNRDSLAIARILAALEPLGLVSTIACTSSYSNGLHLYFPFVEVQNSWEIAMVVEALLQRAGFRLSPGQLELFPNPRPYSVKGNPGLFNAHRLPMQVGSYLLNQDFQPIGCDQHQFVQQWRLVQHRNSCLNQKTLHRLLKQFCRSSYCVSGKAEKFINDLNAEIELGWTGYGQTNRLLGRIAMRTYVFHHVLFGGEPLAGDALVQKIVATAKALPGYREWCRHQHEIDLRAEEWARCVENSRYFHFGLSQKGAVGGVENPAPIAELSQKDIEHEQVLTWNQQRSEHTRERIRRAIGDLLEKEILPANATARFQALTRYGIGGGSLYRHRDLWHPVHLVEPPSEIKIGITSMDCAAGAPIEVTPTSLLPGNDGNDLVGKDFSSFPEQVHAATDGNSLPDKTYSGSIPSASGCQSDHSETLRGIRYVQQVLRDIKERIGLERDIAKQAGHRIKRYPQKIDRSAYLDRMQRYWASGDPILMHEAKQGTAANPDVAKIPISTDKLPSKETSLMPDWLPKQVCDRIENAACLGLSAANSMVNLEWKIPPPQQLGDANGTDFSDLLAQIQVHQECLGWMNEQIQDALLQRFGKASQVLLTDAELIEWSNWLKVQLSSKALSYHQKSGVNRDHGS